MNSQNPLLMQQQKKLRWEHSVTWDFQRGIDLASSGRIDLKSPHPSYSLEIEAQKAVDIKKSPGEEPLKIILKTMRMR